MPTALCEPKLLRRPVARLALDTRLQPPTDPSRPLRVGLLGGSFNPAHAGHRYISLEAMRRLELDQVWWLVSPQNPLKAVEGMAPLAERLAVGAAVARHPRIRVLPLETRLGTRYTADTIRRLAAWPDHRFVWLMGADNLGQLPRWRHWRADPGCLSSCGFRATSLFLCCAGRSSGGWVCCGAVAGAQGQGTCGQPGASLGVRPGPAASGLRDCDPGTCR